MALVGWTSVNEAYIGRTIWELAGSKADVRPLLGDLEQFAGFQDVAEFPLSAIFEIVDDPTNDTHVDGSQVLTEQIQQISRSPVSTMSSSEKILRAPRIVLTGQGAEQLGFEGIKAYSAYIGALFDNFD